MAISRHQNGQKVMVSQTKSIFLAGHGHIYSYDLPQEAKNRGHCPQSKSLPTVKVTAHSLGQCQPALRQAAPDPVTSS